MSGLSRDDIIRVAREAGFDPHDMSDDFTCNLMDIERFANLVAAAEREACAEACEGAVGSASMYGRIEDAQWAYRIKNNCQRLIRARGKSAT
jgi:hypothetical protein